MREWFRPRDLLGFVPETIIPEATTLDEAIGLVFTTSGLADVARDRHP